MERKENNHRDFTFPKSRATSSAMRIVTWFHIDLACEKNVFKSTKVTMLSISFEFRGSPTDRFLEQEWCRTKEKVVIMNLPKLMGM